MPPPRRASRCCAPTSPRPTTRSRRRARCAATSSCSTRAARSTTSPRCASARSPRSTAHGVDPVLHELVLRHEHAAHRDDAADADARAAWLAHRRVRASPARAAAGAPGSSRSVAGGDVHDRRRARDGFAYDNERPRHRVDVAPFRDRAARRSPTRAGCASPRAAATSAASGGPTRPGRGRRSTTSPTPALGRRPDGRGRAHGRAARSTRPAGRPRELVRGRRLRPRARRPPPDRGGVGDGGDLDQPMRSGTRTSASGARHGARRRARRGGGRLRRARLLGNVWEWTATSSRLPGLRRPPLPRVLRGLLRRRLPRPARRLLGDAAARRHARPSATGTSRSAGRSSPACGWRDEERMTRPQRAVAVRDRRPTSPGTSARSPTTSSTA